MSDTNLRYKDFSVASTTISGTWTLFENGDECNEMLLTALGSFQIASSKTPGGNYMVIPSGADPFAMRSGAPFYVSAPNHVRFTRAKYK